MTSKTIKIILLISLLILTIVLLKFQYKENSPFKFQRNQILTKSPLIDTEKLFNKLTLEQKIGQILIIGFEGKTLTPQLENLIKKIHPGGVLLLSRNIENKSQLAKLIDDLNKISLADTGLPLLIAADQEGGVISRVQFLNEKTPQSEIKNENQAYQLVLEGERN